MASSRWPAVTVAGDAAESVLTRHSPALAGPPFFTGMRQVGVHRVTLGQPQAAEGAAAEPICPAVITSGSVRDSGSGPRWLVASCGVATNSLQSPSILTLSPNFMDCNDSRCTGKCIQVQIRQESRSLAGPTLRDTHQGGTQMLRRPRPCGVSKCTNGLVHRNGEQTSRPRPGAWWGWGRLAERHKLAAER